MGTVPDQPYLNTRIYQSIISFLYDIPYITLFQAYIGVM